MRIQKDTSFLPLLALLPSLSSAITFDCSHVRVEGKSWDLSSLGGAHSVSSVAEQPLNTINTTYTLDICKPLKDTKCKTGTQVCGVERSIDREGNEEVIGTINIAGNYVHESGRTLDPKVTRLKTSDSSEEGLRLELHGGRSPFSSKGRDQQAVIQFICDHERSGLETDDAKTRRRRDDGEESGDDGDKEKDQPKGGSLIFKSYGAVDDKDVLRLDWLTKYACEDYEKGPDEDKEKESGSHWGFFTWLVILLFLCTAAYLIFGSWLNYNRYGARGWDLLPHGDTIRDIPYIMKDLGRRVVSTVQGPGARGGYSAV